MNIEEKFPSKIAIFPLSNAIFFPKTVLPLNIFEERYIQLVNDCMKEKRLFGMIQPKIKIGRNREIYKVGCLGKIISFNEAADGRFIITLSGIIRFRVKKELDTKKLYREFEVDYSDFMKDLKNIDEEEKNKEKINLLNKIKIFFKKKNYLISFDEFEKLSFDQLISTVCMISPFSPEEKQKLIESVDIEDKAKLLNEIINFNLLDNLQNKTIQ
tara:strand:- start:5651 stop:6292 length:642 start_codon:yes stop_codon:yes gene_type:complete